MSLADIRAQIKSLLESVTGIGIVHDYERWTNDWTTLLARFKDTNGRINGCSFSREKWREQQETIGETEIAHIFVFRRIMGLKDADATGITFDDNLEAMRAVFRDPDNKTLDGTCRTIDPDWGPMDGAVGLQGDFIDIRMFSNVLCHVAELRLCVIAAEAN